MVEYGVLTEQPETLTDNFFVKLLDMKTTWQASLAARPTKPQTRAPPSPLAGWSSMKLVSHYPCGAL